MMKKTTEKFGSSIENYTNALKVIKKEQSRKKEKLRRITSRKISEAKTNSIKEIEEYIMSYFVEDVKESKLDWEILFGDSEIIFKEEFVRENNIKYWGLNSIKDIKNEISGKGFLVEKNFSWRNQWENYFHEVIWAIELENNIRGLNWSLISDINEKKRMFSEIGAFYNEGMEHSENWDEWDSHYKSYVLEWTSNINIAIKVDVEYEDSLYLTIPNFIEHKMKEMNIWDWQEDQFFVKEYDQNAKFEQITFKEMEDSFSYCDSEFVNYDEEKEVYTSVYNNRVEEHEGLVSLLKSYPFYWEIEELKYHITPQDITRKLIEDFPFHK